jgi:hypothetical protein
VQSLRRRIGILEELSEIYFWWVRITMRHWRLPTSVGTNITLKRSVSAFLCFQCSGVINVTVKFQRALLDAYHSMRQKYTCKLPSIGSVTIFQRLIFCSISYIGEQFGLGSWRDRVSAVELTVHWLRKCGRS